jgi:hypothetical protein
MASKKPVGTLAEAVKPKAEEQAPATEPRRGTVQTVRMDRETLKVLKDASWNRGISQQDIMLSAIRRDLGLEA